MERLPGGIFISSPVYDLVDVRGELESHARALGLRPLVSDLPTSEFETGDDGDSIEVCLSNLRQSDAALFILSRRYGSPLRGRWGERSATHVEYEEALKEAAARRARGDRLDIYFYIRDRLEAEFSIWRTWHANNQKANGVLPRPPFRWILDRDDRLFDLIAARSALHKDAGKDPRNWFSPFKDSRDLKQRVAFDLKRQSRRSKLVKLIESGRVPLLDVFSRSAHPSKEEGAVTVGLSVRNLGPVPATNIDVRFDGCDGGEVFEPLGSLEPGKDQNETYQLRSSSDWSAVRVVVRCTVPTGERIEDQFIFKLVIDDSVTHRLDSREIVDEIGYRVLPP